MKTKQWDKHIEKGIPYKTALELINEYWDKRRKEVYKEMKEEAEKEKRVNPPPFYIYRMGRRK